jgi:hypothetical protein
MPFKFKAIFIICLVISIITFLVKFNSIFDENKGFLYDPASDRIYDVTSKQYYVDGDGWSFFIPFLSFFFGYREFVVRADFLGQANYLQEQVIADRELLLKDKEAFDKRQHAMFDEMISDLKKSEFYNISYYPHSRVHPLKILPKHLNYLKEYTEDKFFDYPDIISVDAVVTKYYIRPEFLRKEGAEGVEDISIELIKNALLIRSKAYYKVYEKIN